MSMKSSCVANQNKLIIKLFNMKLSEKIFNALCYALKMQLLINAFILFVLFVWGVVLIIKG
ncbi:hypothetical protein Phi12:2_gp1 [Cellulophaga phage phi12:2]|uniref:Transmembrane protein n=1 Tax=Cellulophaga phage phi12:2 TaxID=1327969 RepID=R9ZZ90_9VIRU|nr:hypothetical protein Phi12:2_gp1 [Cellulophaga phage phi12:2]AGO47278.1 hypothetical protein Phi12:2_gp1 [Cellulophaga phage phi12:2]